jgi:hypothetical protein
VLTLINFVAALIVSWVVVYAIYGLTLLAVHCVRWTVRVVSWFIVHSLGVTLHVVHPVWWLVRAVARLGEGVRTPSSHTDSIVAPVVNRGDVLAPTVRRPILPGIAVSVRQASEALLGHWRVLWARSEMTETAARTRHTIAQTPR